MGGGTHTDQECIPQAVIVQTRSTPGTADGGHDTQDSRRREGSRYGKSVQRNQATRFAVCVSLAPIHLYAVRPHTTELARAGSGRVHKEVVQASGTIPHACEMAGGHVTCGVIRVGVWVRAGARARSLSGMRAPAGTHTSAGAHL